MNGSKTLVLISSIAIAACFSGCSTQNDFSTGKTEKMFAKVSDKQLRASIIDDASKLGIVDGFYFGEEPRNFKTEYLLTTPETKADFAIDYRAAMSKLGDDMINNWKSYVPYSKRADFARAWWSKNSPVFNKQSEKMKIVWMHEALLDAGELWFRAEERLSNGTMDSPTVLTHDEEQRLVSKYAEDHETFGSLSTQLH